MRRGVTVLVVVVVAAIALAAGIDALRGKSDSEPAAQGQSEPVTTSAAEPISGPALNGTLYYTDADCRLQAMELSGRTPAPVPKWDECSFVLSPDATSVSGAGTAWDPTGDHLFHARDGRIVVLSSDQEPEGEPFPGAAPAWRPDGTLTYFADGAYRERPTRRVLISERELRAAAMQHINAPADSVLIRRLEVRDSAWLDPERTLTVIHAAVPGGVDLDLVSLFRHGRRPFVVSTLAPITGLWTSAQGTFWAVATDEVLLYRDTDSLPLPELVDPVSLAWSPDETHLAIATRASVHIVPSEDTDRVMRYPIVAHDLDWRGAAAPPALAGADEAGEWLGGTGATGRLLVTLGPWTGCTLRALRLPELAWEEEPAGTRSPCRFTLDEDDEVLVENAVPQPGGGQIAVCQNHAVDVFNDEGFFVGYPAACAPAWMPDGRLTFVRNGGLFEPKRPLLSRSEISDLLGRPSALEEIAWVDDERFWAVVRSGESAIVALMTTDRLISSPSFTTQTIEGLRVSASGMVAARTDQGIVFFDTGGRRALTFPNGQAVTWAPGELIAAVATRSETLFVAPLSGEIVTLPLAVRDLEWVVP